ncbi:MAG: hypothetical protein J7M12_05250 [Candidatus Hydrogenedentes bacterium]|nr:hypothetical protein [Candidatus Hydrogenedentota bacterium]
MNGKSIVSAISLVFLCAVPCTRAAALPPTMPEKAVGLDFIGYVKPLHSNEIKASPWGIQAGTLDEHLLDRAAEIGVKWTRLGASWPSVEHKRGVYDWTATDKAFAAALSKGITPFVTLGSGNRLYTKLSTYDDPKKAEIYGSRPGPPTSSPEAMKAWLAFVKATVERYKDEIKYWEIWNEPNHRNYWGGKPDAKEYGRLLRETATLIKKIEPQAVILGGSMAGLHPDFVDGFLSVGTENLVDIITYHNYGSIPEKRIYRAIDVWKVINKYNPNIKLWQGECGCPSHSSTRDYRGDSPWGLNIQAKWLLRQSFTDTFFCKADMSNYFKLVHNGGRGRIPKRSFLSDIDKVLGFPEQGGSRVKTVGVNEKCLLENPGLAPKPGYFAYQTLCATMDSRYKRANLKHKIEVTDQGIFYGIGPEDDAFPSVPLVATFKTASGSLLTAYWLPWHPQEYLPKTARIKLTLSPANYNEPVLVDLLTGKVYNIDRMEKTGSEITFPDIPLADYPFAIVERSEITIIQNRQFK